MRPLATIARLLVVLAALVLTASSARAETGLLRREKLTRAEAVELGLERNAALLSRGLDKRRAEAAERGAWEPYSPQLVLHAGVSELGTGGDPPSRDAFLDYGGGLAWRAPTGTQVSALGGLNQAASTPGVAQNSASVALGVTQPLLKGGWLSGAGLPLRQAELDAAVARELFRDEVNNLILSIDQAYWDLALAEADLVIKTRSRERAKQQYEDTAENIRRGILADVEIYVVEENLVIFDQELLRAQETLKARRLRLCEVLQLDPAIDVVASDELKPLEVGIPAPEQAVDVGLAQNPRLGAQAFRVALASAREDTARNSALPSLDLAASLGVRGQDTEHSAAWKQLTTEPLPEARVGVSFAVPLDRGAVRANLDAAGFEHARQEQELEKERVRVRFEVENAVNALEASQAVLALSKKQVELGELKLQAETDKYKNGISTLADVVRFQRELDNAMSTFQRNVAALRVGESKLRATQGTLHASAGVGVK